MSTRTRIFTETPVTRPSRNNFDLSHELKMSGKFGRLYPIMMKECMPGDTFRNTSTVMARFAPMLAPIMHRVDITTHFFFVPYRLLWDSWQDFITGGQDGLFTAVPPYFTYPGMQRSGENLVTKGSLFDYLGLPVFPSNIIGNSAETFSAFPIYAYLKIWNDYYVDPNVGNEVDIPTELDGNVSPQLVSVEAEYVRERGWERDYFTSNLPWAQRGAEVLMPIQGTGSVEYSPYSDVYRFDGNIPPTNLPLETSAVNGSILQVNNENSRIENISSVNVTNSEVSLNDLRRSMALQKWLEVNARSGHRYNEQIKGHFSVIVPDYRLQRAEYLGGGKQPVVISEVLATANSDDGTNIQPIGDMAGHGLSVGRSNKFSYYCQEHGIILGILSVMPRSGYASQGIERIWGRKDKFDFPWPELANIGEQETLNKELFFVNNATSDTENNGTFGYLPRYTEWKYSIDRIAGDFRDTLAFWHLNRIMNQAPALDIDFVTMIEDGTLYEDTFRRIFYVQDGTDYIWFTIHHSLHAKRSLPYFGVPGGI